MLRTKGKLWSSKLLLKLNKKLLKNWENINKPKLTMRMMNQSKPKPKKWKHSSKNLRFTTNLYKKKQRKKEKIKKTKKFKKSLTQWKRILIIWYRDSILLKMLFIFKMLILLNFRSNFFLSKKRKPKKILFLCQLLLLVEIQNQQELLLNQKLRKSKSKSKNHKLHRIAKMKNQMIQKKNLKMLKI